MQISKPIPLLTQAFPILVSAIRRTCSRNASRGDMLSVNLDCPKTNADSPEAENPFAVGFGGMEHPMELQLRSRLRILQPNGARKVEVRLRSLLELFHTMARRQLDEMVDWPVCWRASCVRCMPSRRPSHLFWLAIMSSASKHRACLRNWTSSLETGGGRKFHPRSSQIVAQNCPLEDHEHATGANQPAACHLAPASSRF